MKGFNLHTTFGASTLSSFISASLFGFTFLQTYTYLIHRSSNDAVLRKLGVCCLWAFDGLQVVFLVWAIYFYLVENFFSPMALLDEHWSIPIMWLTSLAGNLLSEIFFASYIWTLSNKNKTVTAFIVISALGQAVASSVVLQLMLVRLNNPVLSTNKSNLVPVSLQQVFASVGNAAISVSLCYYNHDASTGLLGLFFTVDGFITFMIDRGVLCTVFQVVYLFVYVAHDQTFLWLPFHVASSKLLVNALLAQLNGRECKTQGVPGTYSLSQLGARSIVPVKEQVLVTTKTVIDGDAQSTRTSVSTATRKAAGSKVDLEGQIQVRHQ